MKFKQFFLFLIMNFFCFLIINGEEIGEKDLGFLDLPSEENWEKLEKTIENQKYLLLFADIMRYRKGVIERDFPNSMARIGKLDNDVLLKGESILNAELEILKSYQPETLCPVLVKMAKIDSSDETYIWTAVEISLRSGLCRKELKEALATEGGRKSEIWRESIERWKVTTRCAP